MKANYISMEGNYTVTNGTQEDELNFLVTLSSLEDDYEDDYAEYFDIGHRAATFLRRPPYVLALTVGTVAALANIITILAIVQVRLRMSTRLRLLLGLAVSDTLICVSALLATLIKIVNPLNFPGFGPVHERLRSRCIYIAVKALNTISLNISLLNLLGMAVDHYIAIMRPLHYPRLMKGQRAKLMIFALWTVAILAGSSGVMLGALAPPQKGINMTYNFCEVIFLSHYQEEYTVFVIAFICTIVMGYIYIRIYVRVHWRANNALREHQEFRRTKRALVTTMLILTTFLICWLPSCLFQVVLLIQVLMRSPSLVTSLHFLVVADQYLYDLLLINSLLDPLIYTVRVAEIRCGFRRLFNNCPCLSRTSSSSSTSQLLINTRTSMSTSNDARMRRSARMSATSSSKTITAMPLEDGAMANLNI